MKFYPISLNAENSLVAPYNHYGAKLSDVQRVSFVSAAQHSAVLAYTGECWTGNHCGGVKRFSSVTFDYCCDNGCRSWRIGSHCINCDSRCVEEVGSCSSAPDCGGDGVTKKVGADCDGSKKCWPVPGECDDGDCCCGCRTNPEN